MVLESGTKPSLDTFCHHQITHCRLNYKISPPPPFERKIWAYDHANVNLIKRSMNQVPWDNVFNQNPDIDSQVKSFTEIVLNIMSNFIPNKMIKVYPSDPPWINMDLKRLLRRQQRLYRNYKRHGYNEDDKRRVDAFRDECNIAIQTAKSQYLMKLGRDLGNPNTSQKSYWKILNKFMNKCKAPKIPPILLNNNFIFKAKEKAEVFSKYFSSQCKPLLNNSNLPEFTYLTNHRLSSIPISNDDILSIVRGLDVKKSSGPDGISAKMISLCDDSIIYPLKIIFSNILETGNYPESWKEANITPIHKKGSKHICNKENWVVWVRERVEHQT